MAISFTPNPEAAMLGTVYAQDLKITCIVGIYPKERELLQKSIFGCRV